MFNRFINSLYLFFLNSVDLSFFSKAKRAFHHKYLTDIPKFRFVELNIDANNYSSESFRRNVK